mgnify:FL=1
MVLQRTRPQLPVILASGDDVAPNVLPTSLQYHVRLVKPFSPEALSRAISAAIQANQKAVPHSEAELVSGAKAAAVHD